MSDQPDLPAGYNDPSVLWSPQQRRERAGVIGDPMYCLHRLDGGGFCYAPPVAVLVRPGDGFATPVCEAHVEAARGAIRGTLELVPIEEWLAGSRGYRPGKVGS